MLMIEQDSSHPTGVVDHTPKGNSEVARARERKAKAAVELRQQGLSWDDIAKVLGYPTPRQALVSVELALERELRTTESQQFMRNMAGQRLDKMINSVWDRATDPTQPDHLAYFDRARAVIQDHAKLFGYVAPQQTTVVSPASQALEAWAALMMKMQSPELQEADIFEAEVVEDE